ncbi:MAG: PAS domain-containing protein [Patescibacteria group bacterium]|jgi:nitrogen-specific signal transduction histidine kinase
MVNNKVDENIKESKEVALHYMKTLVEVARESFLILDSELRVVSANPTFYQSFKVSEKETENMLLYNLGNGQWDIVELKKLLEEILPENNVIKDYEVTHVFENIGQKTIVLNARQIDSVQLIILAMEDVTAKNQLEHKLSEYTKNLEIKIAERTKQLTIKVKELEDLNKSMVGREIKMVELQKTIEELKKD